MTNLIDKDGYINRKIINLPREISIMNIIVSGIEEEKIYKCEWVPSKNENLPDQGFLGTAVVISGEHKGNGYHAWDQNDSEFIYYKILV